MENDESDDSGDESGSEIFEVAEILSICYCDPNKTRKYTLYFKVSNLSWLCCLSYYANTHAYNDKNKEA